MASHGITRTPYSKSIRSAALREEELSRIEEYNALARSVLSARENGDYSPQALKLTADLLRKNPEFYTIWNYRKEILLRGIIPPIVTSATSSTPTSTPSDTTSDDPREGQEQYLLSVLRSELTHIFPLLKSHPKCYSIWNHRLWTLRQSSSLLTGDISKRMWKEELGLINTMLGRDERNFHGWMYRRFVVSEVEGGVVTCTNAEEQPKRQQKRESLVESEFAYTTTMIQSNMSNYSAWHNRSKLIPRLLNERNASPQDRMNFLEDEIEFLHNALITKPSNQSLWFYHHWLIHTNAPAPQEAHSMTTTGTSPPSRAAHIATLDHSTKLALVQSELSDVRDMLESLSEHGTLAGRKWILATLVGLTRLLRRLRRTGPSQSTSGAPGNQIGEGGIEVDVGHREEEEEEEEEEAEGDVGQETSDLRTWVNELVRIEGEKGRGRRWVDLRSQIEEDFEHDREG